MIVFFALILTALVGAGALYWRWWARIDEEIAEGAALEWAHFQAYEPEFLNGMSEEKLRAVYAHVHMPRFPGYALATLATFLLSLPVIFAVLSVLLIALQSAGATPNEYQTAERLFIEDGKLMFFKDTPPEAALYYIRDLAGFYYFFGVLLSWLAIVAFYMRRYHKNRPGYLRDEIIRARP